MVDWPIVMIPSGAIREVQSNKVTRRAEILHTSHLPVDYVT
jgi:hypothetical protein